MKPKHWKKYPWAVGYKYRKRITLLTIKDKKLAKEFFNILKRKYKSAWINHLIPLNEIVTYTFQKRTKKLKDAICDNNPLLEKLKEYGAIK